ncbi:MAG: LptF/LptG family permease [Bacteroidota bacterium]
MKKIDRLLLVSFLPPFMVTFGIATFVLLMQILWVYIDDIAGKGLGMFIIMELLAYKAVGLVPMALPLAILISGVMVMGGLAERYELSSFKSAGVSLLRVMRPLVLFATGAMFLSYLCNDYIIPVANLQFGSRMYDIREKKPTLSLEAGVFNDDFGNYAIRIGEKGRDGRSIKDILIYDHTDPNSDKLSQVMAESGEMASTPDGDFFVMQLYNGHQYIETRPTGRGSAGAPFIRTSFQSWNKVFDLSEFDMAVTDTELFSNNRSMMSISQLSDYIDTIQKDINKRYITLAGQVSTHFRLIPADSLYPAGVMEELELAEGKEVDSLETTSVQQDSLRKDSLDKVYTYAEDTVKEVRAAVLSAHKARPAANAKQHAPGRMRHRPDLVAESETKVKADTIIKEEPIYSFIDTTITVSEWLSSISVAERRRFMTKAKSSARAVINQSEQASIWLDRKKEDKVKFIYEMHTKYSMALVCIIFVFVGAPLGAIVRKGGFGYPLLVSVVAFIIFIVLTIFCRKIAETFLLPAALAAWLPCLILAPIGVWLTLKARSDSKLFDLSGVKTFFVNLFSKKAAA